MSDDLSDIEDAVVVSTERRLDGSYACSFCSGATWLPRYARDYLGKEELRFREPALAEGPHCSAECLLATGARTLGYGSSYGRLVTAVETASGRPIVAAAYMGHNVDRRTMLERARATLTPEQVAVAEAEDAASFTQQRTPLSLHRSVDNLQDIETACCGGGGGGPTKRRFTDILD